MILDHLAAKAEAVLRHAGGPGHDGRFELARLSRLWPHKFLPTLLSAWRSRGEALSPAHSYELELFEQRNRSYRELGDELTRDAAASTWKGANIASAYPDGLVRQQDDLDLCVENEADAWRIATGLVGQGWTVTALTLLVEHGQVQPNITLERPSVDSAHLRPDRVEIAPALLLGDQWRHPVRPFESTSISMLSRCLVLVLEERLCRRFGARDYFDLAVVLGRAAEEGTLDEAVEAVRTHSLFGPWEEARGALRALLPDSEWATALPSLNAGARRNARRTAGWLGCLVRHPTRTLALGAAYRLRQHGSARACRLLTQLQGVVHGDRLRLLGVPMHGLRVGEEASPSTQFVATAAPLSYARTPLGTFALTAGGDIPDSWLETAAQPDTEQTTRS